MSPQHQEGDRAETDASLRAERHNTDHELARRVFIADADADAVLQVARERADRLLQAARAAADARLPLSEQTASAVSLLLEERADEDAAVAADRARADELLGRERRELRETLLAHLVLERQTTDLRLALERRTADSALSSRDEFLAHASHDLRGLMAAQKLYIALLVKDVGSGLGSGPPAAVVAALTSIADQMDRLVNDLVDVVAMDAGKLSVALRRHPARDLLSTAVSFYEPLARERGHSLSVGMGPPDIAVQADLGRVVQVLGNLLSNAIKFTPPGGEIRVGFEASGDEVMFFVADTGPGVPSERSARIFERFAGSNASSGLGLGLFIAAGLVAAHGGRLWLDPDQASGSVFRFTLKRA